MILREVRFRAKLHAIWHCVFVARSSVRSQQLIIVAHPLRTCGTKPLFGADVITAREEATQSVAGATSLPPVSATMWQHVVVSLLWLALSAQWMTVVPIIVPDQVAVIVGGDSAAKEGISGTILAAGAVVALVVAPISGALSDRSQHRRGRRRLFLIAGVLGSCVGLSLLLPFGPGASLWLYAAAFIFLQFWWNWVAGAYAGLIPDVMAEHEQGRRAPQCFTRSATMSILPANVVTDFISFQRSSLTSRNRVQRSRSLVRRPVITVVERPN